MSDRIAEMAEALIRARTDLKQIPPLRESHGLASVDEAYAVQDATNRLWLERGRRLVGRKIGLTSPAVQAQMGIDQPDFGMLWGDYFFTEGEVVDTGRFMQPKAELEVAFVMDRGFSDPEAPMAELIRRVAYAVPALEVVDTAIRNWDIRLVDTVADNASGGGFLLGLGARRLTDLDLRLCGGILSRNGKVVSRGLGVDCMGNPLNATLWLARRMAELGQPLLEGDVVMSGAFGPMVPVGPGEVYLAEIAGFSPIQVSFDDGRTGA
ncbi:2-keto-4-pentenoate hydratase [Hoeflea sp.]|uniref:2-keto-4-pentenoate hydratase n=1 Tax=Hoeflea sp. TaxID=1940281 RepID=UPI00198371E4|nr:2-keto-4-pentenoate hydratase [Hoeflea sp.]MBC7285442.1 2-keto-4-pentenoate hydratase [Hoeflea sp.]